MVFPGNSFGVGSGREAVKQWRPSRSAPGVSRGRMNRMGCGACWDETHREKGEVARGGWADVARRLPASSSVWIRADISTRVCNLTRVRSERHKCQK